MKSGDTITTLLEPQIPPRYLSLYQILSLNQQSSPPLRRLFDSIGAGNNIFVSSCSCSSSTEVKMIDPKGQGSFVRGPTLFIVTGDFVVSTAASTSIISTLNQMKIPVSDVVEQELNIGMEEALSILQASLTSTYALTNGFKQFLKRRPKQEK